MFRDSPSLKETLPKTLRADEHILLRLEEPPWGALYRVGIGYIIFPLFNRLSGSGEPDWRVVFLFFGVLFALRLIPAMVRKLVRFSQEATSVWLDRRQLAKDFDSYQWKKLFWLGVGMASYMGTSGSVGGVASILTVSALLTGGIGLYLWHRATKSQQSLCLPKNQQR